MRSLYWKIFLSFWLATILIIIITAWATSEIAQKSSIPAREQMIMDSYATAAIATFESSKKDALKKWLKHTGDAKKMTLYLLSSRGEIIGNSPPTEEIEKMSQELTLKHLDDVLYKQDNILLSHEILSTSGIIYRLAALINEKPSNHLVIPWAGLTIRLFIAIVISGLICYILSIYLTKPLRSLSLAAKSIATGKLNTRVGHFKGHTRDEIAELSAEFDRMAEQLETLIHSKERLLQDISHELRSPLARLQIAIELGRKKFQAGTASEFTRMEVECLRLNTLIGEILEFARMDKSADELDKKDTDLGVLIQQIIDDANFEFTESSPRVLIEKSIPCSLFIDKRLVHRAIENIVRNALRYSPCDEKVLISITRQKESNQICIEIKDRGPGVPDNMLDIIFHPFYRVDTSREKKTGGYGLGLAIAQKAIHLHKGDIQAFNREGGGLLIRIFLPYS